MNGLKARLIPSAIITLAILSGTQALAATAPPKTAAELASMKAETQVRNLLDPLLQKYCQDECKLLSVKATVDVAVPEQVAPGFDDLDPSAAARIEPSSAQAKLLIDEKLGPVSRRKLLDLLQQYIDTLDFPVKIDTQVARFPEPAVAAGKVAELRERVTKKFRDSLEALFTQFCPESCLLTDYSLQTETVNLEEAQYGATGEYFEESGVAIRVKQIGGTILVDEALPAEDRANLLAMAKLRTNEFKNVDLTSQALKFPRPSGIEIGPDGERVLVGKNGSARGLASSRDEKNESNTKNERFDSTTRNQFDRSERNESQSATSSSTDRDETTDRKERFERFEKIERVENGDAVQQQLKQFQWYALAFGCGVLGLLVFIAIAALRGGRGMGTFGWLDRARTGHTGEVAAALAPSSGSADGSYTGSTLERAEQIARRLESDRLRDELLAVFAQQPKVAKHVFARVLQEEGLEVTAAYLHLFGESVVIDLLRDPSLQSDLNELTEFYARNPIELKEEEILTLLKKLHARTLAGKLAVIGQRSSSQFDFLADMDGLQLYELVRNESMTVKAILLTQCDNAKRGQIFAQLDEESRMRLLAELSRIDYLPRDYISNVAGALKRKRNENPKLNTEALPGSEVLVNLLERAPADTQLSLIKNLERANPDSARTLKSKLVSINTLRYLRDSQLLEVVLSLRHDELLQFLKGAPSDIRNHILTKTPRDLGEELVDELGSTSAVSREQFTMVERKILNRMKVMANEGLISLAETNERMYADFKAGPQSVPGATAQAPASDAASGTQATGIKRASGW